MGYILLWIFAIYGMIRFVFGIGKGITSFVKGMFLGAIDGYKHPEKYPNHLSKEEQRRQRHREERARQKMLNYIYKRKMVISYYLEMTIFFYLIVSFIFQRKNLYLWRCDSL